MIKTGHSSLKHAHSATPCTVFPNPICRQPGPASPAVVFCKFCSFLSLVMLHCRLAGWIINIRTIRSCCFLQTCSFL